jgi:hypothetical protein
MRRLLFIATSAVLLTSSISAAYASPNSDDQNAARKAKQIQATLSLMDRQIADVSNNAFVMNHAINHEPDDSQFQSDELADIKAKVNTIGRELAVIEAERNSLPQWETAAADQVQPIMHNVAVESTQAIRTFNADQHALFADGYSAETNDISNDATKAAQLLRQDIQLAKTQAKGARLSASLKGKNAAAM